MHTRARMHKHIFALLFTLFYIGPGLQRSRGRPGTTPAATGKNQQLMTLWVLKPPTLTITHVCVHQYVCEDSDQREASCQETGHLFGHIRHSGRSWLASLLPLQVTCSMLAKSSSFFLLQAWCVQWLGEEIKLWTTLKILHNVKYYQDIFVETYFLCQSQINVNVDSVFKAAVLFCCCLPFIYKINNK